MGYRFSGVIVVILTIRLRNLREGAIPKNMDSVVLEKMRNEMQKTRDVLSAIVTALATMDVSIDALTTATTAIVNGLSVYTTATLPSAVTKGAGFPVFNSDDRMIYVSDGANWVPISSVNLSNFALVGATLNAWYTSPSTGTALSTATLVANRLYAMPFIISQKRVIDQVAINVTAFVAGNIRLGIYKVNSVGYPGTLVADFGVVSSGSNGVKTLSASPLPVTLGPGLYYLALVSDNASVIRGFAVASLLPVLGISSALGTAPTLGYYVALTYGALPSTFTAGGTAITAAPLPAIFVRFSS